MLIFEKFKWKSEGKQGIIKERENTMKNGKGREVERQNR